MTASPRAIAPALAILITLPIAACAQPGQMVPSGEVPAGQYQLDPTHASILFRVNHMGFADFYGRFDRFDASIDWDPAAPEAARLSVSVDPASVNTNVEALDEHMASDDLFDAANHPEIRFTATGITITGDSSGTLTGDLTMLGETRPVTLDVTFQGAGTHPMSGLYTIGFSAETEIMRSDWGLTEWSPFVGDAVTLLITAEFNQVK